MCTTYTGRLLTPTNYGVPSPLDIAVQLGRLPRFAGATRVWPWSVLHHVRACYLYAKKLNQTDEVINALLLHDAEECATGDIPTTWKSPDTKVWQAKLSSRIFRVYGMPEETWDPHTIEYVKDIDLLMCVAEMYEVGPRRALDHSGLDWHGMSGSCLMMACDIVRAVATTHDRPQDSQYPDGALVLWLAHELVARTRDPEVILP